MSAASSKKNNFQITPPSFAYPWRADCGDGLFQNPVLYADYSDPDVIRVGNDFYLTASSFNCTPGLPILHSKDLVNWTIINHALKNVPDARYEQCQPGCGVWAPAIRFHAGKYWIFFPTPDEGIYVVTANHPAEKWSEPYLLQAGRGLIDPCPFWDDNGQAYLVHAYAGSRAGIKHRLRICPMASDGSRLLGEGEIIFHEPEKHPTLEGPKLYKRDGWYYILAPAGGVENGWQVALRAKNIYGPYEDKIVLAQGRTGINGPHQGALVDTPAGDSWFVHFQDAGIYGRIIHVQPVCWENGWPVMGEGGEPVLHHAKPIVDAALIISAPQTSDEFNSATLGLQWQWNSNHRDDWYSLTARPGWLRLFPQPATAAMKLQPNLLLQKFPARTFVVETQLEFSARQVGETAGLIVNGAASATFGLQRGADGLRVVLEINAVETFAGPVASSRVRLRAEVFENGTCEFSYAEADEFQVAPERFLIRKGIWIGAKVGLYSRCQNADADSGFAEFDSFRFAAPVSGSA